MLASPDSEHCIRALAPANPICWRTRRSPGRPKLLLVLLRWLPAWLLTVCLNPAGLSAQETRDEILVLTGPRSVDGDSYQGSGGPETNPTAVFIRDMMAEAGVDHTMSTVPWPRAVQRLDTEANILVYSMIRTRARESRYVWVGMIQPIETYLYGLAGKLTSPPASLEAARDYRIGVARSSASDNYLAAIGYSKRLYIPDASRAAFLMERDRFDLTPYTVREVAGMVADGLLEEGQLVPHVHLAALSGGTYFALSKQTEAALASRLQQAYSRLVQNGRYAQFLQESSRTR